MTYEQLDLIADSYVPALWLLCLAVLLTKLIKHKQTIQAARFLALPVIVYGCMFIDNYLSLWPSFGLDYSTHTAAAIAGCSFLWQQRPLRVPLAGSLLAYSILMIYQQYHSWLDILTTSAIALLCITATNYGIRTLETPNRK